MNLRKPLEAAAAALMVPRDITIAQWAEENMFLTTENSSRPGRVVLDPFQREPMECLSASHPCRRIVMKCGSQLMKTFIIQAAVGYAIDIEQGPVLIGEPREKDVKAFTLDRLDPMLRDTPCLQGKVMDKKSRDSGNTMEFKKFKGGSITIAGAQSPENFAMRAVRWLFLDEPSRYPLSAGKEGNPIKLARQRQSTFPNSKELICGTPTVEGACVTEEEYQLSDQREWFVPCPECGHEQVLRWSGVKWGQFFETVIEPAQAHYECESCKVLIPHFKKAWMNERGRWIAQNPESVIPGFHATQLISPRKSWGEIAVAFLEAKGRREDLIVFTNTVLAEAWREQGEAPDHEKVIGRAEEWYLGTVPDGALFLTAGVDVQKDRLEMQVQGWGRGKTRWVVDYVVIDGDTSREEVWQRLTEAINVSYESASGLSLPIARVMIDSGYATTEVYTWARSQWSGRVLIGKGYDRGIALLGNPTSAEVDQRGKKRKFGVKVWPVNVSMAKAELYGQLKATRPEDGQPFPAGYVHIPRMGWVTMGLEEFCAQLTAEEWVIRIVKGYKRGEWRKARPRNEALDTSNLARAAAEHIGVSRFREEQWAQMEQECGVAASKIDQPAVARQPRLDDEPVAAPLPPVKMAPQLAPGGMNYLGARRGWFGR
jgi:phage terminase large subunit GpA-like protein